MQVNLPESIINALLDKLGHDDDFRDLFSANPRAALAQLGYGPATDKRVQAGAWWCLRVRNLASKEVILSARSALHAQFAAEVLPQFPFMLDATMDPASGQQAEESRAA